MAKAPGESKIPVLHSNQLRSRFSNISSKVRSHLDGSYRTSSPSMLFGLFSNTENKVHPPTRPSSLFKSTSRTTVSEKDVGSYVELTRHSKTGILRYFGKTVLGPGDWCGVEVDSGHGVCDGSICGVRYFSCRDQCALFVLAHLVRISECQNVVDDKTEAELMSDDGCTSTLENWDLDILKTEFPFECTDSLGILSPDQMVEFRGDEANYEVPGLLFKMSPHQLTECISDGDVTMNDLETISMPKDDDLVSPVLSSDPSNHTVSEHDSASAYPKRSTVSFGHVFYDNFTIDRTPSLEDLPMDDFSSKTTTAVVPVPNIPTINTVVTSITSVSSLDTGYQGDCETSRPTSRGATVKRLGPTEPMTDSDFFTESEAEDHCHRKAIVIDGTLYSRGDNVKPETQPDNHNNPGPTIEEMDSSGVYSDFDRIFEEPPVLKDSSEPVSSNNSTSPSSVNSQQIHIVAIDQPSSSTIPECTEDASSPASKRYKRPTPVKPKTLEVRQDQENRAPRTRKPAGRWDAVMNKIEKSKTDQKTRINRLKDVKSKINSINPLTIPYTNRLKESPTNSEPLPVRSHRENTPLKAKSRRTRARGGSESNLPMSDLKPNSSRQRCIPKSSQNSSRDSSFSDLSGETKITLKQATSHPSLANKNFNLRSPSVNVVVPSVRKHLTTPSKATPQNRRLNSDHSLTITKTDGKTIPSQVNKTTAPTAVVAKVKGAKRDVVDRETLQLVETRLDHVTKGFDAVSVLFQYLVNDMDALSTTRLKQQLDANHIDLVSTKCSLDESRAKCIQYQEEIHKLQKEIDDYKNNLEIKEKLVNEITSLKETEIYGLEKKLEAQANNLRLQFNEELNKLRNESDEEKMKLIISHDQQIVELQQTNKLEVSQMQKSTTEKQIELTQRILVLENERDLLKSERDVLKEENQRLIEDKKLQNTSLGYQKLLDEVESLRTVLELKSSEMQDLRKQNEKLQREGDDLPAILQKLEAAQSRVEDLNVQLQRKSEIEMQLSQEKDQMAREIDLEKQKKKRLSCHNEELQWKLKKSTEVANHLAVSTKRLSQTPQDLAAMREAQNNYQKLCSRESSNSENSGDEDTMISQLVEVDSEAPARILGVMKKNDSLSYVFEVEEEPSEIATRLVRRASSLRSVGKSRTRARGPAGGEKRSRASSQSGGGSSDKSVELDSALTRNLDELFAPGPADRYLSDCFTCSSDSSNSSPEHHNHMQAYEQNRGPSYVQVVADQTGRGDKVQGGELAIV
uniref:Microtubule-associated tumor suppressor 1 n=1 Tax=Schizaphis graminum TaxID=13262 RepID=A0A2S2NL63_SCHGA